MENKNHDIIILLGLFLIISVLGNIVMFIQLGSYIEPEGASRVIIDSDPTALEIIQNTIENVTLNFGFAIYEVWAEEGDAMPSSFETPAEELATEFILTCFHAQYYDSEKYRSKVIFLDLEYSINKTNEIHVRDLENITIQFDYKPTASVFLEEIYFPASFFTDRYNDVLHVFNYYVVRE